MPTDRTPQVGAAAREGTAVGRRWGVALTGAAVAVGAVIWALRPPAAERASSAPPSVLAPAAADPPSPAPVAADLVAEAKRVAAAVLKDFPDDPPALLLAGRIAYAFNDTRQAEACWNRCLERAPAFAEASAALGEAAWEHGEFEKAVGWLERALRDAPTADPKVSFFLADALLNLGEAPRAVDALLAAEARAPLPAFGLFLLGLAYAEQGRWDDARRRYEAALAADPQAVNVHFGLAAVYERLGDASKAALHRGEYQRLKSQEMQAIRLARNELRKSDWADVRPLARECFLNAGKVYAAQGRAAEAERMWLRAAALDRDDPEPRQLLDLLYWDRGLREAAVRARQGRLPPAPLLERSP